MLLDPSSDLKLVLLGHKNVGKTSIFNRYVYDEFGKTSMTIGAYFGMKQCNVSARRARHCAHGRWAAFVLSL